MRSGAAIKDEAARIEMTRYTRPRNEALINRNDPEYVDLVGTQAEVDLVAAEFGDLCVVDHQDVPIDVPIVDGEGDVVDEPLAIVERFEPPAFMDSPLATRDRRQTVILCVAEYEGRMRMKAEHAVDALTSNLQEARKYEVVLEGEAFRLEHELQEEYELRGELQGQLIQAEKDKDELKEEVTRLKALFQDVSLLTREHLEATDYHMDIDHV